MPIDIRSNLVEQLIDKFEHPLQEVFDRAVSQATKGKGQERHGKETPFLEQPWVEITDTHGLGFLTGQAEKKIKEAMRNKDKADHAWWEKEMLGSLNYLAMAIIYERMK